MLYTALVFGFFSSFHCAGMCGPIALAVSNLKSEGSPVVGKILYNLGRMYTYALLGLIFGFVGKGLSMAGLQQGVSIVSGILIIIFILIPRIPLKISAKLGLSKGVFFIKKSFSWFLQRRSLSAMFFTGVVNGLLPCGMVYMALAASISLASPVNSGLYLTLFGLGTFPVMLTITLTGSLLNLRFKSLMNKTIPYLTVMVGILFILRGMSLGIPYMSPVMKDNKASCCSQSAKLCH